jgi:hypothetical protein
LPWIANELGTRVFKRMNVTYKLSGEMRQYEKDRFVNEEEINMDNLRKRFKYYDKKNITPTNEFEKDLYNSIRAVKSMFKEINEPRFENIDILKMVKKQLKYLPLNKNAKNKFLHADPEILIKLLLETVKEFSEVLLNEPFSSADILSAFKPIFHMVYEDNEDGLFSEEEFDKYNCNRIGQTEIFDGNYKKYYNSKIYTLTKFK